MNYKLLGDNFSLCEQNLCMMVINRDDIESIRGWRNAQTKVLRQNKIITKQEQIQYFEHYIFNEYCSSEPSNILFSLFFEGTLLGYGGLVHVSWENKRAEISFLVSPEVASNKDLYKDIFTSFLKLTKVIAINYLGLRRIFTETFDFRNAHISILEDSGFVREGVMNDHVIIEGRPCASIIHGFINKN